MARDAAPAPVPPRDAATVLVLRDDRDGLEVFCVRRHAQSAFLGGAVVYPGGKLDAADAEAGWRELTTGLPTRATSMARDEDHAHALAVCACRETLEEGAIVPTDPPLDAAGVDQLQVTLAGAGDGAESTEPVALRAALDGELRLDTARLVSFARWITPEVEQRRFDTRFFLLALPNGQAGKHDEHETTASVWAQPAQMLAAQDRGELFMAPPTIRALELLAPLETTAAALALAAEQSLEPICPRFVAGETAMLVIPGDPLHDIPDRRVAGPTRFVLRDARFVSEDPPARD